MSTVRVGDTVRCHMCPTVVTLLTKYQTDSARHRGRVYCSPPCAKAYSASVTGPLLSAYNRKHASARMKNRNPMHRPDIRAKMATTLRAMKWAPTVRGGNGKPLPLPQQALSAALGWPTEVPVPTLKPRGSGYPSCYKVDIANEALKFAIEVDGNSHYARKDQDTKKDGLLTGLGWTVLRFTNKQVTADLAACVQTVLSTISKLKPSTPTRSKAS